MDDKEFIRQFDEIIVELESNEGDCPEYRKKELYDRVDALLDESLLDDSVKIGTRMNDVGLLAKVPFQLILLVKVVIILILYFIYLGLS